MQYKFPRYPTRCTLCDRAFEVEEELVSAIFPAEAVAVAAGAAHAAGESAVPAGGVATSEAAPGSGEATPVGAAPAAEADAEVQPNRRERATVGEEKAAFMRHDYCLACAAEPPDGAYSEWRTHMPLPRDDERVVKIDTGVVFDFFQRLAEKGDPEQSGYVYFLGLYLMRKRKLKFLDSLERGDDEVWVLESRPEGVRYEIVDPRLDPEALESIRQEIMDALSAGEMEL